MIYDSIYESITIYRSCDLLYRTYFLQDKNSVIYKNEFEYFDVLSMEKYLNNQSLWSSKQTNKEITAFQYKPYIWKETYKFHVTSTFSASRPEKMYFFSRTHK